MGNSYSTAGQQVSGQLSAATETVPVVPFSPSHSHSPSASPLPTAKVNEALPNMAPEKTEKKKKPHFKYDGRLDQLISPDLMCYFQSVHEEKGEPVFIWGYTMQWKDVNYGKSIQIVEENSIYTSYYGEIFDNIDNVMPIWKGNDRMLTYEDNDIEIRVAFANKRHAKHFLHCFKCYRNGDSWPRNDSR